jgi:hypothetical protein
MCARSFSRHPAFTTMYSSSPVTLVTTEGRGGRQEGGCDARSGLSWQLGWQMGGRAARRGAVPTV